MHKEKVYLLVTANTPFQTPPYHPQFSTFQYKTYFKIHAAFMKLIYKSFNLHGIMELIYEFIRLVLQSIKPIYQSTIICGLRAAHFLRLRRHNAVQLGIFGETVYKGQNDIAIK